MRIVSYLRVSSRHQVDGDGFDRQREAIDRWTTAHQASHVAEFVEEGISGTTELVNRPALTRLVSFCLEHGPVDAVIIEKADRLARELIVGELLIRQFSEMGVRVIEAEGGNDLTAGSDNPTATLVRQILAAVAEFEKSSIVSKLRAARNRVRAQRGKCEGNKAIGEKPGELRAIEAIAHLHGEGLTIRQIAAELDARGIPTRGGGKWHPAVVQRVVQRLRSREEFEV